MKDKLFKFHSVRASPGLSQWRVQIRIIIYHSHILKHVTLVKRKSRNKRHYTS